MFFIELTFEGVDEGVTFFGDPVGPDEIHTSFGNDIIEAGGGDDFINPGAGDDDVEGGDGDDTIVDGLGNDTVDGGNDNDSILLLTGENSVQGGDGNDYIRTGYKTDDIQGNAGNDIISADSGAFFLFGNDTVDGGAGDDLMQAGAGADTFVFRPNEGNNTIGAFDEGNVDFDDTTGYFYIGSLSAEFETGIDKIRLEGFSLDASTVLGVINDTGAGAVFDAEGTRITFYNVTEAQLSVDDFIFA